MHGDVQDELCRTFWPRGTISGATARKATAASCQLARLPSNVNAHSSSVGIPGNKGIVHCKALKGDKASGRSSMSVFYPRKLTTVVFPIPETCSAAGVLCKSQKLVDLHLRGSALEI